MERFNVIQIYFLSMYSKYSKNIYISIRLKNVFINLSILPFATLILFSIFLFMFQHTVSYKIVNFIINFVEFSLVSLIEIYQSI